MHQLVPLAGVVLVLCLPAQTNYVFSGDPGDGFGSAVRDAGDVNDDGRSDVIVGAPGDDNNGIDSGSARVFSGIDGTILYSFVGAAAGDAFGTSVAGAGDVNGDGFDDLIAGAPGNDAVANNAGRAVVFSGRDGSVLYTRDGGAANDRFGESVSGAGDVNGDGYDDFIVGSPGDDTAGTDFGAARIYSGRTGALLRTHLGVARSFGAAVAGAGDANGDGFADVVIGEPEAGVALRGIVWLFSGLDGSLLQTASGLAIFDLLGSSVGPAGDVNGDGFADYFALASSSALVFSGRNGSVLYSLVGSSVFDTVAGVAGLGDVNYDGCGDLAISYAVLARVRIMSGKNGSAIRDINFGIQNTVPISAAGDVDRDGFPDLLVGLPNADKAMVFGTKRLETIAAAHTWTDASGSQSGASVCPAGDVDGDGHGDVVVGSPRSGLDQGTVRVFSGRTKAVLYTFSGAAAGDRFGSDVDGGIDLGTDGVPDVVASAPFNDANGADSGSVRVFSGSNGTVQLTLNGDSAGDEFGASVSVAGDVNLDGRMDFIAGAPGDDDNGADSGSARVFSGDGTVLYTFFGDSAGDRFGTSVAGAGDLNGDGFADLIVGAPGDDDNGADAGSARAFSGANGAMLFTFLGSAAGDRFGTAVAGLGDTNGDRQADLAVGAPGDDANGADAGSVRVHSGADGSVLRTLLGEAAGDALGSAVGRAGDVDCDGRADLIVGAPNGASSAGYCRALSIVSGALLLSAQGDAVGDGFGSAVTTAGDTDRDGLADLLVGAPLRDGAGTDEGLARLFETTADRDRGIFSLFGAGCPDSTARLARIGHVGRPVSGGSFSLTLALAVPSAPAALHLDIARQNINLGIIGFPSCTLLALPFFAFPRFTTASGTASVSLPVSSSPTFIGVSLYAQYLYIDTGANTLAATRGLEVTFGRP
jgi:hypothetical protein